MSNKKAKERLIKIYGDECFIEKLHLRHDTEPKKYTGKKQMRRMKQLTYHHIRSRSKRREIYRRKRSDFKCREPRMVS